MSSQGKKYSNKDSLDWLQHSEVTPVLSMALGELYLSNPQNQLYFLGNWLLNYSKSRQNLNTESQNSTKRELLQEQYEKSLHLQQEHEQNLRQEAEKLQKQEEDLKSKLLQACDVYDLLPKLINHIKDSSFAAAGYFGLLEKLKRAVTDLDDEKAHVDEEAPLVLRYINASDNSGFMIGQVLKEEEGQATWSIWKEEEEEEPQDDEDQTQVNKPRLKIAFVEDVVNDPRIKFFDVPKLGSYLAAPVTYASCLFESSFDAGVEDFLECKKKRIAQEEEKVKYEASKGEEEEARVFEEIKLEKFKSIEVKLVLALDTLGLDKVFKDEQKEYVIDWALMIKSALERSEEEALRNDIEEYAMIKELDNKRFNDKSNEWAEEEKSCAEEITKSLGPTPNEEVKQRDTLKALFEIYRNRVVNDFNLLMKFKKFRVVKYSRVFQLAFYLAGVEKDKVVEPGTNMILWKKGRELLNEDFENFIKNLNPMGGKSKKPEAYSRTIRLEKDLQRIPFEEVQNFSVSLGFLYKFLDFYIKTRIADVIFRRKQYLAKVEDREVAQNAAKELYERKMKYVEDMREAFEKEYDSVIDEEKPIFDPIKLMNDFDLMEGNSPITIPEVPISDIDEDIDWEESNPSP